MFYDGTHLLNKLDINGKRPEIFLVSGNRNAGKTTFFYKHLFDEWLNNGKKFGVAFRFVNELDNVEDVIFKDICGLFYPDSVLTSVKICPSIVKLILDEKECGYAFAINAADKIKRYSHFLSDTSHYFMDEFQSEVNRYCPDEMTKFMSVHKSIARGHGQMTRYVPVYMAANAVTILNPYFSALGIADRIRPDTKFLRGNGFVAEFNFNQHAKEASEASAFDQAFAHHKYMQYSASNVYLLDNKFFVEKIDGVNRYLATVIFEDSEYAVREYPQQQLLYVDKNVDLSYPVRISATTADHRPDFISFKNHQMKIDIFRTIFNNGQFRFRNLECKKAMIALLSYH